MSEAIAKFFCDGCQKGYNWKKELSGKRAKCKGCGKVMTIPAGPATPAPPAEPPPIEDDLYSFAEPAPEARPKPIKAPPLAMPVAAIAGAGAGGGKVGTLGYQRGPTPRQKQLDDYSTFVHMPRDRYVPIGMIVTGAVLYSCFYIFRSNINIGNVGFTIMALTIMTLLETALLVGFALVVSNPLGVGFGPVGSAILKLAAIVVINDGIGVWLSHAGTGSFSFYLWSVSFLISAMIYWVALAYLFELDHSEAWLLVVLLSLCYRALNFALFMLLLALFVTAHGPSSPALQGTAFYVAPPPPPPPSATMELYNEAQHKHRFFDAAPFASQHKMVLEQQYIKEWKDAGAKSVNFELVPVGFGSTGADLFLVELPTDPIARAKCFTIAGAYYTATKQPPDPELMKDTGDPYLAVPLILPDTW